MRERYRYIFIWIAFCFAFPGAVGAYAQSAEYAQTLYAPVLQSTAAGDLGIALSNPTRSPVTVIATARSYAGDTLSGTGITNPVVLTLPALGQRALFFARSHNADWTADQFEALYEELARGR